MYLDEIAKRKRLNTPMNLMATPTTSDITLAEAYKKAQFGSQARGVQDRANLAQQEMQADERLSREWQDYAKRQANIATGLSLGNLGLMLYKGKRQGDEVKKQNAIREQQFNKMQQTHEMYMKTMQETIKSYQNMLDRWVSPDP